MKYLVFSDIHGNYTALKKMISRELSISAYLFLGDFLGYGPEPDKCIRWARKQYGLFLAGNHDISFLNENSKMDPFCRVTKDCSGLPISKESHEFLSRCTPSASIRSVGLVHGSPIDPQRSYILNEFDAAIEFSAIEHSLTFFGHTHQPIIYTKEADGRIMHIHPIANTVYSLRGKLALVNPGSAGQPRDGDPSSSYLIFDSANKTVIFRRSAYSVKRVQKKIRLLHLSEDNALRLETGS